MNLNLNQIEFHQDDKNSIVRTNMLKDVNYRPYCGNSITKCDMPRMIWSTSLRQMQCLHCGFTTQYPSDFINRYKQAHQLP